MINSNMRTKTNSTKFRCSFFIGVDPGKRGAISIIEGVEKPTFVESVDCPLRDDGAPDVYAIAEVVRRIILDRSARGMVEKIQAFGKDRGRRKGLHKLTGNAQQWLATLVALGVHADEVLPQKWMATMIGRGLFGEANRAARFECMRKTAKALFPTAPIELVKHTDRAASLLIADYCRRDYRLKAMAGLVA